jgi:hypothetical protein
LLQIFVKVGHTRLEEVKPRLDKFLLFRVKYKSMWCFPTFRDIWTWNAHITAPHCHVVGKVQGTRAFLKEGACCCPWGSGSWGQAPNLGSASCCWVHYYHLKKPDAVYELANKHKNSPSTSVRICLSHIRTCQPSVKNATHRVKLCMV